MPMITALIPPSSLNYVENELLAAGLRDLTISECVGYGRAQSLVPSFAGGRDIPDILPTARIEFAVSNDQCQRTIDAIIRGAQLDKAGRGTIFVSFLERAVSISGAWSLDDSSQLSVVPAAAAE
jgi:nitrogen regulatory protein P-II 1